MAAAKKLVEDWAVQFKDRGLVTFKDTSGADPMTPHLTLLGDVQSTTTTLESSTAAKSTNKDFSSFKCAECNVTGHSSKWGGCPTATNLPNDIATIMLQAFEENSNSR